MSEVNRYDVCIIGAGLIGLSVAHTLVHLNDGLSVVVIDKEEEVATHQSTHNSGVVHSGLYYKPGSLKAKLCVAGRDALYEMCEVEGIPVRRTGKLVIATRDGELPALDELERRGRANGLVGLERIGREGIAQHEPHATGIAALFVPEAGVADYPALARVMATRIAETGGVVRLGAEVTAIRQIGDSVEVVAGGSVVRAKALISCAGLQADRVAAMAGIATLIRMVPFRGEYYRLKLEAADLVNGLIYPVPDPRFPFLGVHFTRRITDVVEVGPNAVLAAGREQYRGVRPDLGDLRETMKSRGFRQLARRHWRYGVKELVASRSKRVCAAQARKLMPAVEASHLMPGGVGVRAQAIRPDGSLVEDFIMEESGSMLHVLNAPSPGATACLAIARHIVDRTRPFLRN